VIAISQYLALIKMCKVLGFVKSFFQKQSEKPKNGEIVILK